MHSSALSSARACRCQRMKAALCTCVDYWYAGTLSHDKRMPAAEEDLVSRPLGATEHIQDQSVYAPGRTKED